LTIDLIRAARKVALDHNTSVNNLARGSLESVVKEPGEQKGAMEMEGFFRDKRFALGKKNWTRADLHGRHA